MLTRPLASCVVLLSSLWLGGCSTMQSIQGASEDFSELAKSATKLADASASTIERAKESMAVMDEHMGAIGEELKVIVPKLAEDSRVLVQSFEKTTREMGAATTTALEQTSATMKQLTPDIQKTLGAIAVTTEKYGTAIEKIGDDMGSAAKSLRDLAVHIKESSKQNRAWVLQTQEQLGASMKAAERTLDQTAASLVNLETGLLDTLRGTTKTLQGINKVLRLEAEDEDEVLAINGFRKRLDSFITLFLWILMGGGLLLVVMTTLVVYGRLTARKHLRLQLAALGIDTSKLP